MVATQEQALVDLDAEGVTRDFFHANVQVIEISDVTTRLYGPWCVEAGTAIDFSTQVSWIGLATHVRL